MRRTERNPPIFHILAALFALLGCVACAEPVPEPEVSREPEPEAIAAADPALLLPNGAEPFPGLITGGQPTLEQLDAASAQGVKTVINLRMPGESEIGQADVEARGMAYVAVPIGSDGLTRENSAAFAEAIEAAERPAIVHCGSGNRVGALFALRAFYDDGAEAEAALAVGRKAGLTRLEGAVQEHLAGATRD